jgi:hypothetical protein
MSLETLLREAAPEAHFDAEDVQRRVDRTRRRRRGVLAAAAALVVVAGGVAGVLAAGRGGDDAGPADPPHQVPLTADALVGSPWVALTAGSAYAVPTLEFRADGTFQSHFECTGVGGRWAVGHGDLTIRPGMMRDDLCSTKAAVLGNPTLLDNGVLRFASTEPYGPVVVDFRRLDDLGRRATEDDLVGVWLAPQIEGPEGAGGLVVFEDNTLHSTNGCEALWTMADGRLGVVARPGCQPFAPRQGLLEFGVVGGSSPWLVDGALVLVQDQVTTRLVPFDDADLPVDLTGSPWLLLDAPGTGLEAPRLVFGRGGDYTATGGCDIAEGTWSLQGDAVQLDATNVVTPFCTTTEADALLSGVVGRGRFEDGTLVFGTTRLRQLSSLATVRAGDLVGRWSAGGTEVAFEDEGRLVLGASCVSLRWSLDEEALALQEDPASCELGDPQLLGDVFPAGGVVPLRRDGESLYVGDDVPFVLRRIADGAPPADPEPPPLHGVDDIAELHGTWRGEGEELTIAPTVLEVDGCTYAWTLADRILQATSDVDLCNLSRSELAVALVRGAFARTNGERLVLADANQVIELQRVEDEQAGRSLAERLLRDAYEALGVDTCCQEPPEGRDWGLIGFVWDGRPAGVIAAPPDEAPAPSADRHAAICGGYVVLVDGPVGAADALFDVLHCGTD